jgi:transposase-like protein
MYRLGETEKKNLENLRKVRAFALISKGDVPKKIGEETFVVPSQSNPEERYIVKHTNSWRCNCMDYKRRQIRCKHIQAVQMYQKLMKNINNDVLEFKNEFETDEIRCARCNSLHIVKKGNRKTKQGLRQTYKCKECGYRFTPEPIKHRKADTKLIALCMDLYYKGMSLRKIADTVYQFYNVKIHHDTVRVWINTFMKKIRDYTDKIEPNVGDVWNVDECVIKTTDEKKLWNYNIMDKKTRFLITNHMENGRHLNEAKKVFEKAMNTYDMLPEVVITDGLTSYPYAIRHTFGENVKHIKNAGIAKRQNNNLIERYHGTWRQREKVMRGHGDKIPTEELLDNYRTYYNFIRGHTALDGQTPSEEAGINLNLGRNKWMGLLEQSL